MTEHMTRQEIEQHIANKHASRPKVDNQGHKVDKDGRWVFTYDSAGRQIDAKWTAEVRE